MSATRHDTDSFGERRSQLKGRSPWMILLGAIVLQGATSPGQTIGVSVFIDQMAADLDLTRSGVSSAYLIGTIAGAVAMPAAGKLIDNRGLRFATLVFGGAFGAVLVGMAGVAGFATLALGFAGTRAFGQGALTLTATTTVAVWFDEHRGLANGIKMAAGGALMALVPIASSALIAAHGWRTSWVILGIAAWVVVVPLGLWLIRNPERAVEPPPRSAGSPVTHVARESWPVAAAIRQPAFLAMTGATALSALVGTALLFHHLDLLGDRGLSASQAAVVFLPLTVSSALSALVAGRAADLISPRFVAAFALVLLAASPLLVQSVTPGVVAGVYGVVLGAAGAMIRTVEATALPRWFGIATIGQLRGIVLSVGVGGSALGPLVVSLGRDLAGSYGPVLNVLAAASMALAVLMVLIHPPTGRTHTAAPLPAQP